MSKFSKDHPIVGKGNMALPMTTSTGAVFLVPVSIIEGQNAFGRVDVKVRGKRDIVGEAIVDSRRLVDLSAVEDTAEDTVEVDA